MMFATDASVLAHPVVARAGRTRHWLLAVVLGCILALNFIGGWVVSQLNLQIWPQHIDMIEWVIIALVIAYVLAMAVPFLPGIEIGLALMLLLGPGGIALVYLCTQFALALSFLLGRLVPMRFVANAFGWLQFDRSRRLVEELSRVAPEHRIQTLSAHSPQCWISLLLRHRYLALAVIFNLPGNAVIGGAGGIGMIAGMTRAYPFPYFAMLMALSTLPVPLFLIVTGSA